MSKTYTGFSGAHMTLIVDDKEYGLQAITYTDDCLSNPDYDFDFDVSGSLIAFKEIDLTNAKNTSIIIKCRTVSKEIVMVTTIEDVKFSTDDKLLNPEKIHHFTAQSEKEEYKKVGDI